MVDRIPGRELGLRSDRVYRMLDHPREMARAAISFDGCPVVIGHLKPNNPVGEVGNVRVGGDWLLADIEVDALAAVDAIRTGEPRQVSIGFAAQADMTPGVFRGHAVTVVAIALYLEPPPGVDRPLRVRRIFMRHQSGRQDIQERAMSNRVLPTTTANDRRSTQSPRVSRAAVPLSVASQVVRFW